MRLASLLLLGAVWLLVWPTAQSAEPDPVQTDEQTLKEAKVAADDAALLKFFADRTLNDVQRDKINRLIVQMGGDSFLIRERATAELAGLGGQAVSLLRQAISGRETDIEVVRRAERCLAISGSPGIDAVNAAARLLGRRKTDGAAAVLLGYLPYADDESTLEAAGFALGQLAVRDGKAEPALVKALEDPLPLRRGMAGESLALARNAELRPALLKLLRDPDAGVRLRTALGLADVKDRDAVPVLIDVIADLPTEQSWRAEYVLCKLAGDQMPLVSAGPDAASRKKCRDAWAEWWAKHGEKVDMARLHDPERLLGYTLIVQINPTNGQGQVVELGADNKPRWQIGGLQYPVDAQVVRQDRVLIVEYNGNRVTERDFAGKVLWTHQVASPLIAQRLANGNTFIACHNQLVVVDPAGKAVSTYARPAHDIMTAARLRDGQLLFIANGGMAVRVDTAGKELKSFATNYQHQYGGIDVLPNGRILVPQINTGKVVEFDAEGKSGWTTAALPNPSSVMRLPNGNTLIGSFNQQKVVEIDPAGKVVWEHKPDGRPWKVKRR